MLQYDAGRLNIRLSLPAGAAFTVLYALIPAALVVLWETLDWWVWSLRLPDTFCTAAATGLTALLLLAERRVRGDGWHLPRTAWAGRTALAFILAALLAALAILGQVTLSVRGTPVGRTAEAAVSFIGQAAFLLCWAGGFLLRRRLGWKSLALVALGALLLSESYVALSRPVFPYFLWVHP